MICYSISIFSIIFIPSLFTKKRGGGKKRKEKLASSLFSSGGEGEKEE